MTFTDHLTTVGRTAEDAVIAIYRRFLDGQIERALAVELIAVQVERHRLKGAALADAGLASVLSVETGTPVPVVSTPPPAATDRLVKAAVTVLEVAELSDVPEQIMARLARAETYEAAQDAYAEGIKSSELTEGWTRGLEANSCQLCVWWWREGRVWPKAHPMPRHKGCVCNPIPVVKRGIKSTGYTQRLERRAAAEANTGGAA